MKKISDTSVYIGNNEFASRSIPADTMRIVSWNGIFFRAIETKDFIYFCNYHESDDNANCMMYSKDGMELVSDNYFASNDLFELMTERSFEITFMTCSAQEIMKAIQEENEND